MVIKSLKIVEPTITLKKKLKYKTVRFIINKGTENIRLEVANKDWKQDSSKTA